MSDHFYPPRYVRRPRKARRCECCRVELDGPCIKYAGICDGYHWTAYTCVPCARVLAAIPTYEEMRMDELAEYVDCGYNYAIRYSPNQTYPCGATKHPPPATCATCQHGVALPTLPPLECEPKETGL